MLTFTEASELAVKRATESGTPLTGQETEEDIFKLAGQLPDKSPVSGGVGSDIQTLDDLGLLPAQGSFASSVDLLQTQREEAIGTAVTGAQREFDDPIRQAREDVEKVRGGATAAATRHAGGLGLDTATQGFIQSQVDVAQKAVSDLEKKRDDAIRNARLDTADEYDKLIIAENKRISDLRQQTFENILKIGTARRADEATELAAQKFGLDIVKFEDGQARFERTQGLAEIKEFRIVSQEERDRLLDDITRMAESGIPLDQMSDEEITKFEIAAELPSGTFEAFYSKLSDDAQQGEVLDKLKIDKAKADIQNVYSTISERERKKTEEVKTSEASSKVVNFLSQVTGGDGFVSPDDYIKARNAWISDGLDAGDFDDNFSFYVNPTQRSIFPDIKGEDEQKFIELPDGTKIPIN